jgi:hypothetical protein
VAPYAGATAARGSQWCPSRCTTKAVSARSHGSGKERQAEVARRGLEHLVNPDDYAARVIAGDPGPSLTHHAWGSATDLNASANPQGLPAHQDRRLVAIFERWGFTWAAAG